MVVKSIKQVESSKIEEQIQMGGSNFKKYTLKNSTFTAESNEAYVVDTSNGSFNVLLPPNPETGDVISIADARGTWNTNPINIINNGNNIEGNDVNFTNNSSGTFFSMVYIDTNTGWRVLSSGTKPLNITLPSISGNYELTVTTGSWTGSPTSFNYKWQISDDGENNWSNIESATSNNYTVNENQEGKFIRAGVIATNSNGPSLEVFSTAIGPIDIPDFPSAGLLYFWNLNDLTDSSGNGKTLTNNNNAIFGPGKINNAVILNGSANLKTSSVSINVTQDFSISLWMYPTELSVIGFTQAALVTDGYGGGFIVGYSTQGKPFFNAATSWAPLVQANTSSTLNEWVHVVCIVENGIATIYTNGIQGTSTSWNGYQSDVRTLCIGIAYGDAGWDGKIDAIGIWNRALTQAEIMGLYSGGNGIEHP